MRVLELFSGYGSQALALENLGIEFTSDISKIDKYAIQAYNQLHGETHNWGDVTKIDETKLPHYDLITYSSPCQDFSVAGLGKGGDVGSGTRSSLLWECERIIRAVKPKYLLMENVKNLVGEKHKHNFIRWLHVLEMMGYQNYYKVLNAKDYGVPQNRERVFVVSILGCQQYLFPNPIKLEKRLKDVLESDVDEKYYLSQKLIDGFIDKQARGSGFATRGINIREKDGYASTLTARMWKMGITDNYVQEPRVAASRGRENGQELEINETGCSNTLTSVQKDNYLLEPLALDEQNKCVRTDGTVGTLTTDGSSPKHNNRVIEPTVQQVGNIIQTESYGGNPERGRVYSDKGVSPCLSTMQGGGLEPKIMCYDIQQIVTVRKNTIDTKEFAEDLRKHKKYSNQFISEKVGVPITTVEHWFRTDKSQSIPNPEQWFKLKELLGLDDRYDAFVTEFEEREGTYEKANRCYGSDGLAPTLTNASSEEKIIHQYRIRKLTPRECWRLQGVRDEQFDKLHDLSNTQLYKLAGNSIVVDVLMGIFKNLLLSDEETTGQLRLI